MSCEQVGISLALAEISKAAVGPYEAYEKALRVRHEVTGVSYAALTNEASEGEAFYDFVTSSVRLFPPLETTCLTLETLDRRIYHPRIAYRLGKNAVSFTTTDSVRAEALWSSISLYQGVPHYIVGNSEHNYLMSLPEITLASDERFDHYFDPTDSHTLKEKVWQVADKKLTRMAFNGLKNATKPEVLYPKSDLITTPGACIEVQKTKTIASTRQLDLKYFLELANGDTSEENMRLQTARLHQLFDADQKVFILDEPRLATSAPSAPLIVAAPDTKRLSPEIVAQYSIMERLTVLALRFSQLDAYAHMLSHLYSRVADIRDQKIRIGNDEFDRNTSGSQVAEHIIQLLRTAQEAEEEKTTVAKSRNWLGFGRRRAIE